MGERFGNYCYYQLDNSDLQCPDEKFFEEEIEAAHIYTLSPDEQFITVIHGGCTSWGDDGCPSQVSVFGIENDVYINLGYRDFIEVKLEGAWDAPYTAFSISHDNLLWRPAIQP